MFVFLGRSATGRRMTAEDELEQLSGSGHSSTLALSRTPSWTSAPPSYMSLDAWLAGSGVTWEVVWRRFDLLAGRRLWLGCAMLAVIHRKLQQVHRRAWRYSSPTWKRRYCTLLFEPSRQLAECARDSGHVYGSCTPSLSPWRDSKIIWDAMRLDELSDQWHIRCEEQWYEHWPLVNSRGALHCARWMITNSCLSLRYERSQLDAPPSMPNWLSRRLFIEPFKHTVTMPLCWVYHYSHRWFFLFCLAQKLMLVLASY